MSFKPLLAKEVDWDLLTYDHLWLSPKLDGIRAIVRDGVVMSRNLKPIPNAHVQKMFGHLEHYDGELIVGDPRAKTVYHDTYSGVMSADGTPNVQFYAFDHIEEPDADYETRYEKLVESDVVVVLCQHMVCSRDEIHALEERYLTEGYEGVMLRKARGPNSKYKFGRATARSCTLLKCKRFTDSEAMIIGFEELMKNGNEATTDALGHTVRSSHQENLIPMGTLGALVCRTPEGVEFRIGTGFDQKTRQYIWNNKEYLDRQMVRFKSFKIGEKDAPRFPVYLGFRSPIDM